jgi:hypothetical protein
MSTSSDVAIVDLIEADRALEFVFELLGVYSEVVVVEIGVELLLHLILF